jgi:hypothetical protein
MRQESLGIRMFARWAKTASVQVDSIEAFDQLLSTPENRDELILDLGRNVFGPPNFGEDSKGEHYSPLPPDLVEALKEIAARLSPRST